jgi:hypothetical protein
MKYQYSDRRARPLNLTYLLKHELIACPNPIVSPVARRISMDQPAESC